MIQGLDQIGFFQGALDSQIILFSSDMLFDHLDRPSLFQLMIPGSVHLGHTALANQCLNLILTIDELSAVFMFVVTQQESPPNSV